MQELRVILIIVGAVVIAALFLHGLWTSKREKPTRLMGRSDDDRQNNQVPPLYDDKDGLGEVRIVKPNQTRGRRKEPELHFTDSHRSHTGTEDALFENDALSRQYFDDEQEELPASSTMPSQSRQQMTSTARTHRAQGAASRSYSSSQEASSLDSANLHQAPAMSQLQRQQEQMMQRQSAQSRVNQPIHHKATSAQSYAEENRLEEESAREEYAEERYKREGYVNKRQSLASHANADVAEYDQGEGYPSEREKPLIQRPNSYYSRQDHNIMSTSEQRGRHPIERNMAPADHSPLIERNASMKQVNQLNSEVNDEISQGVSSNAAASFQTEQTQQVQTSVKPNPVRRQPKPTQEEHQSIKEEVEVEEAVKTSEPNPSVSKPSSQKTQVFCLSVQMRKNMEFRGRELVSCLQHQEMLLGEFDIFHRHSDRLGTGKILFSVANMFNPGSFPMKNIHQFRTQGITFFMSLPCHGEAEQNFNLMLQTAQEVADALGGDVRDHEHNLITPQRIDEYREQIRQFYT